MVGTVPLLFGLMAVSAFMPLIVIGQAINVGGRVEPVGGNSVVQVVTSQAINSSDLMVLVSGDFADYSTGLEVHWFWYRNTLNADFQTYTTSLVATTNISMISYDAPYAVRSTLNSNVVMLVHLAYALVAQPINLLDPLNSLPTLFFGVNSVFDFDGSLSALSHSDNSFSAIFGARNATKSCIMRLRFNVTGLMTQPSVLYCPHNTSANTSSQAWSDPTDPNIFYITASHANNVYATYKCINALSLDSSCSSLTQATVTPANQMSFGRRGLNSNAFFYVYTSAGKDIQVIAVDFVGGFSSIMTVPLTISTTQRTIALIDSTVPNSVTMLVYDQPQSKILAFDLSWNPTNKQVSNQQVATLDTTALKPLIGSDMPATSLSSSVYGIASCTAGKSATASTLFFGRTLCGDGLVSPGEECDSVPNCNTTICKCFYGANGSNLCNSIDTPVTPVSPPTPLSVPISPPTTVSVPISPPFSEPVAAPDPGNGTTIIAEPVGPTPEDVPISTIVPTVVVPVVVVAAGVILLVVLLRRRKKRHDKQSLKDERHSDEVNLSPMSSQSKMEPVNYFAVPTMASPELGKDSNTSAGTNITTRSNTSDGSAVTVHSPLDGIGVTLKTIASTSMRQSYVDNSYTDNRLDIPYSELKFIREIGAGAYGKVFIGEWQKTNVALKISAVTSSDEFVREAELIINLRPHPNVVQVLGLSSDGVNVVMIMEFCDGGSLDSLVFDKDVPMKDKIHLLSGIAKGIYHLHKNKIVHRDLAARNILLSRGEPKISDFGMSRKLQEATAHGQTKATVGPIRWMAPECLRSAKYSTKSDVWSFGVLCWEVLSGEEPHLNSDPLTIGVAIRDQGVTPSINSEWDPALQSLLKECWSLDPDQRPEFDEICERLRLLDN